jgi:hypothetical protein
VTWIRKISIAFGVLYLITFVTSIPAPPLYQPVLDDPVGFVANGGSDNRIYFGALLELLLIIGYLMYRSGLGPPRLALLGLVGGPLIILTSTLAMFD